MAGTKRFSEWDEEKAPKDYDPEADIPDSQDEDGSDSDDGADFAGTEHYSNVGKSKLRQKEGVSLGPQYRGARVSRQALEGSDDESADFEDAQEELGSGDDSEEEFDDPETADLAVDSARFDEDDAEIDSEDALGDSDDEKLANFVFRGSSKPKDAGKKKKRPTAADFISGSEDEEDGLDAEEDDDDDDDEMDGGGLLDVEADEETDESELEGDGLDDLAEGLSGSDDSEDDDEEGSEDVDDEEDSDQDSDVSDEDESTTRKSKARSADTRAEQRKLMSEGQKALVATISAAAQQDAEKGMAVRQQRKAFDGLLNIRIRLQKALVATNSFGAFENETEQESAPYEAAEEAALKLLDTLDSVRATLLPEQVVGEKRKRASDGTDALWEHLQEENARSAKYRKKVLETWSNKTKNTTVEVKSRNLVNSQQSIIASLEDQLLNSDRLIKRTRTPRSCAPVQVANKVNEDEAVYDDADFYQVLLKELVDQRTSDETSAQAGNASLATVRWAAMKEAKTKKHVDRRASKGRKMRFNIHEKLQNFMAPEDRRGWEQDAIDRLFGTLFGQKMELGEGGASDDEMDEVDAEEEGLRLFRS